MCKNVFYDMALFRRTQVRGGQQSDDGLRGPFEATILQSKGFSSYKPATLLFNQPLLQYPFFACEILSIFPIKAILGSVKNFKAHLAVFQK